MSNMKVLSALAALVATASIVAAQDGTFRPAAPPAPAGTPEHDPSAETVRQFESGDKGRVVAYDNDPARPQPSICFQVQGGGGGNTGTGFVEILPYNGGIGGKSLADTLTLDRRGRVWWDYAREVDSVNLRLLSVGQSTLLVPIDSAIMKLAKKPHQNNDGQTSDDEAEKNVERFLAAHIIPDFNKPETDGAVKNLLGTEVEIVQGEKEGSYVVQPGDIEVVELSEATNGRILYLNGVLPFRE